MLFKINSLFCFLLLFTSTAFGFDHTHADWSNVLKNYQTDKGLIKYKQLKEDAKVKSHKFNTYLKETSSLTYADYNKLDDRKKMAYLINAYNAFTIKLIVDKYPVDGIKDIGGFFSKPWGIEFFSILNGKIKSLDPIEHKWLRPKFKDYRIHAAVNCASISCPPLRNEAYVGEKLDAQLDDQMKAWLSDPSRNSVNPNSDSVTISKIFDWYEDDFRNWGGGVLNVINKHSAKEKIKNAKIKYMNYNWDLNEAK